MDIIDELNFILKELKISKDSICFHHKLNNNTNTFTLKSNSIKDLISKKEDLKIKLKTKYIEIKPDYDSGNVIIYTLKSNIIKFSSNFENDYVIPLFLGESPETIVCTDLNKNPHILISGTTGSGKSTLLHCIIKSLNLLNNIELTLIDPKYIEFSKYKENNNVIFDSNVVLNYLDDLIVKMNYRYKLMERNNLGADYFQKKANLKHIVTIIDEFADLFLQNESIAERVKVLAQKGRAAGIHLIIATQRPSSTIIDGVIKANFPARICLKTASRVDSRIVLDKTGAESLAGNGDAIINNYQYSYLRFQSYY